MSDETISLKYEGNETEIGLAELAELDVSGIEENYGGFEVMPRGRYVFHLVDAVLDTVETKNGTRAVIRFETKVTDVLALVDPDANADEQIGKDYTETIWISDLVKGVGMAKAIMKKAGFEGEGKLTDLLDAFCGADFAATVKHRKDKNDADKVYTNWEIESIEPVV